MSVERDSLEGYFKTRYADKMENLVPSFAKMAIDIPFNTEKKLGKDYRFPVRVRRGQGVTFNGGAEYGTAFAINAAKSGVTKEAAVSGTEFVHRDAIAYGVLKGATSSMEAFGNAFDEVVGDMTTTAAFYREMAILYGGTNVGAITGTPSQPTSTTATCVISAASWAAGLWSQMEGAYVDVYNAAMSTKRNANADLEVTGVDVDTRTVYLSGDATDIDALADTDVCVPKGAESNWFNGIDKILTNTSSLFGIDAATYRAWKGTTYSASNAALTFAKVTGAANRIIAKSGMGDLTCYMSTFSWTDLNQDSVTLRRFVESTKGGIELGTDKIEYLGANGRITLKPHSMIKAGEAMMINPKQFRRIGTTDTTFNLPEAEGSQPNFLQQLPNNAGVELRCFWDQGLICMRPAGQVKITGITNTAT